MCYARNEKWKKTNNKKNRAADQESIRMLRKKENYKNFGIVEADTIKQVEKNKKRVPQKKKKISRK